jgi:hypothetical protein
MKRESGFINGCHKDVCVMGIVDSLILNTGVVEGSSFQVFLEV